MHMGAKEHGDYLKLPFRSSFDTNDFICVGSISDQ